tara:strand:- start:59199 stop:60014 length:816 start_codon:yes stop_codon:yes gene_type:complete
MDNAVSNNRLERFFHETKHEEFDNVPTSLVTTRVVFESGSQIDEKVLYENIPIYTIPGYDRGKKIKVTIPFPGIPFVVLSAKIENNVRGIVKNFKKLNTPKKNGRFATRLSIDVAVSDRVLNVMFFPDSLKISGGTNIRHASEAFVLIKRIIQVLHERGIPIYKKLPVVKAIHLDMENLSFNLGYQINLASMAQYFKDNDKTASMPAENEALRIEYPMGINKTTGDPRYYSFRVRHTGKVMFSGNGRKPMEKHYKHFIEMVTAGESQFRFD